MADTLYYDTDEQLIEKNRQFILTAFRKSVFSKFRNVMFHGESSQNVDRVTKFRGCRNVSQIKKFLDMQRPRINSKSKQF